MNVRVYDRDILRNGNYLVEWSDDDGTIGRKLVSPSWGKNTGQHIPFRAKDYDTIRETLVSLARGDWQQAERALLNAGEEDWVHPLRGMVFLGKGKKQEADREFRAALETSGAPCLRRWLDSPKLPPVATGNLTPSERALRMKRQQAARDPWYELFIPFGTRYELIRKIKKAPSQEKMEAIARLEQVWRKYRRHDVPILRCADLILAADRNIPIIEAVSEYAVTEGGGTPIYVGIAEQAALSGKASQEFLTLARVTAKAGNGLEMIQIAVQLARARNDAEIREIVKAIEILDRSIPDNRATDIIISDSPDGLKKKMKDAKTREQRIAIEEIMELFNKYGRHIAAAEIADRILAADRNISILVKIAEYAIVEGSNTLAYINIADYAARAPLADQEFLRIAELIKENKAGLEAFALANQAMEAKTGEELQKVRDRIALLENKTDFAAFQR
jgi:hypothetical protein